MKRPSTLMEPKHPTPKLSNKSNKETSQRKSTSPWFNMYDLILRSLKETSLIYFIWGKMIFLFFFYINHGKDNHFDFQFYIKCIYQVRYLYPSVNDLSVMLSCAWRGLCSSNSGLCQHYWRSYKNLLTSHTFPIYYIQTFPGEGMCLIKKLFKCVVQFIWCICVFLIQHCSFLSYYQRRSKWKWASFEVKRGLLAIWMDFWIRS